MKDANDHFYISQTLRGNTRAFENLVIKYQQFVYTITIRILKNKEEAEEVAQDTFVKAFEALATYRGEAKFSSWLYSIAYRKALDRIKKNKRLRTLDSVPDMSYFNLKETENALTQIEHEERSTIIKKCIEQLPEEDAAIVTFYYFEELSVKEIASITKRTEGTIKIKLFRSRKKLHTLLQEYITPEITNNNGKAI